MNLLGNSENKVSLLKDPFKSQNINAIQIFFSQTFGEPHWSANIEFKNGQTEGKQKFKVLGAEGLPTILKQMEDFVKSL